MKKGKLIFGIIVGVVAIAGAIAVYKRMKASGTTGISGIKDALLGTSTAPSTSSQSSSSESGFPLQNGSRGKYVEALQKMLLSKYGRSALPVYGADGIWGSETESSLKAHSFPTVISSSAELAKIIAPTPLPN